jgi:hypothetical protein
VSRDSDEALLCVCTARTGGDRNLGIWTSSQGNCGLAENAKPPLKMLYTI